MSPADAQRVDELLDTLSHHLRREVIHYFENETRDSTAPLDAVVSHLEDRVPGADADRLRAQLAHRHLPKLAARGWLDYDSGAGVIRYHGHDSAEELLHDVVRTFALTRRRARA